MSNRERGFTLIEIMVVVAIIGILAAVAIPVFAGQMKKSKTAEAMLQLNMLAKSAKTYYEVNSKFPQGTAGVLPGADGGACSASGKKFAVTNAWASDAVWLELDFHIDELALFSYHYESTASNHATATAVADLDCDGTTAAYTLDLSLANGNPAATITAPPANAD
jgi:prepilin-type N-terminal cleavage/methylation domain-containing protein